MDGAETHQHGGVVMEVPKRHACRRPVHRRVPGRQLVGGAIFQQLQKEIGAVSLVAKFGGEKRAARRERRREGIEERAEQPSSGRR